MNRGELMNFFNKTKDNNKENNNMDKNIDEMKIDEIKVDDSESVLLDVSGLSVHLINMSKI